MIISCHSFVKDGKTISGMSSTILSFHELNWYYFIVCSCCWQWNCISSYTLPGGAYILCHLWNRVDFKHSIHKENKLLTKSFFVHRFPIKPNEKQATFAHGLCSYLVQNITPDLALQIKWTNTHTQQIYSDLRQFENIQKCRGNHSFPDQWPFPPEK